MTDIPQEIQEVLADEELQKTVKQQPGSQRFKAMVLGLSAFQYIKEKEKGPSESEPEENK